MPNSVRIGFGPVMKTGSSIQFKWYPTTYMWVSSQCPFTVGLRLSWFILIYSKRKTTFISHVDCCVSFGSSWACFHGRAKTYGNWVWHSSKKDWRVVSSDVDEETARSGGMFSKSNLFLAGRPLFGGGSVHFVPHPAGPLLLPWPLLLQVLLPLLLGGPTLPTGRDVTPQTPHEELQAQPPEQQQRPLKVSPESFSLLFRLSRPC